MSAAGFVIRAATRADLPHLGALAESLVRQHHELDPLRFHLPEGVARGYVAWFGRELECDDAALLVAEETERGALVGYLYGHVVARDFNQLLDRHGALHDVLVTPSAQRRGVAEGLIERFAEVMRARGVPRVVLHTATQNERAQALFRKLGFRPTMLEMTREL